MKLAKTDKESTASFNSNLKMESLKSCDAQLEKRHQIKWFQSGKFINMN